MAHSNIPLFDSPAFPQLARNLFDHQISRVNRTLSLCCAESSESSYGACDGLPCPEIATITDIASGLDYCAKHFRESHRG